MLAGIREILIISTPMTCRCSRRCWATAAGGALSLSYAPQPRPEGLAQAFIIGAKFVEAARRRLFWVTTSSSATACRTCCKARLHEASARRCLPITLWTPSDTAWSPSTRPERPAPSKKSEAAKIEFCRDGLYCMTSRLSISLLTFGRPRAARTRNHRLEWSLPQSRSVVVERMGRGFHWLDTGNAR